MNKSHCYNGHLLSERPRSWGCWRCRYNDKRRLEREMVKWREADENHLPRRLLVYGTLKRGFNNHRVLGDSHFIGVGVVPGGSLYGYAVDPMFGIPFAKMDGGAGVHGEIYEVEQESTLRRLDRLEGHPHGYRRTRVKLEDGSAVDMYVYQGNTDRFHKLEGGAWGVEKI